MDMISSGKTICILPRKMGLGGPNSFQSGLIEVLHQRGYRVSHNPQDPANSVILVIGGTKHVADLRRAQRLGVRVVQRLNGMNWVHRQKFTGVRHFIKAEIGNLSLSTVRRLADRVVYQSGFARSWWERVRGKINSPQAVIYNGVDLDLFSPGSENSPEDHYRVLLVEGHHGGGYEQGLITAVKLVGLLNQRLEKRVKLSVVGDVPEKLRQQADGMGEKIDWRGVVSHEEIPSIDCSAHVLFASDINAACPNSVIEAMACGLPVVAYDTGSLPELVKNGSGKLARYGADVWKLEPPDIYALADAAQAILQDHQTFSAAARRHAAENFDINRIVDRYLEILLGD